MKSNRRSFIKSVIASAAAPLIVPSGVLFGKSAPSNQIRIGSIGNGRMGRSDIGNILSSGLKENARIVAVCDADRKRLTDAKDLILNFYREELPGVEGMTVEMYADYRDLIARDDIDAVCISTPDFWHGEMAIRAAKAGKDIYLQKPLTFTIEEGRRLATAVRQNGLVLQTGSQQRSSTYFRHPCELVRNGLIGQLREIEVRIPTDKGIGSTEVIPVPENFNYNMWWGPRKVIPYTVDRTHPQDTYKRPGWMQNEHATKGNITNWGAHMIDIAQWGNGTSDTGPVEIEAEGEFPDRGVFNVHTGLKVTARYENGVTMNVTTKWEGAPKAGVRFTGDEGWIFAGRGVMDASDKSVLRHTVGSDGIKLYESKQHYGNWLECIRSRRDPVADVETAHRSNSLCLIAHTAMKRGKSLKWDPAKERFTNDKKANRMLKYKKRQKWL